MTSIPVGFLWAHYLIFQPVFQNNNLGGVAQRLEQWLHKPCVGGSSPPSATLSKIIIYMLNSGKNFIYILKILLLNILVFSNIHSQKGLTIFSGYNMSTIKYNDNKIGDQIDISARNGSNIGLEYRFPRLIVGAGFLQRGSKLKEATTINIGGIDYEIEISGYEVYNYAAAHIFYPISINEQIEVFGGMQVGSSLGGTSVAKLSFTEFNSSQSDEIDMKPKGFGLDAGLQFGVDYMLNHRFGLRSSYYMGMTNVRDTLSNNLNFKNSTISLSAIIKLKGLRKKPNIEKPVSKINTKSRLLLPENAIAVRLEGRLGSSIKSQSKVTLGYGLRDDISIGISNSNYLNTFDFFARTNYLNKLIDKFGYPINLVYNSVISKHLDKTVIIDEHDKLNFLHQLIIEYKSKSNVLFKLCPTYVHKNIVDTKLEPKGYPWDIWFIETGLDWFFRENVQLYTSMIQQITDLDISEGSKSSIKVGLQYYINSVGFDLSITNLYHLHGTAIADDIGINNYDEKLRLGFQINKMFN